MCLCVCVRVLCVCVHVCVCVCVRARRRGKGEVRMGKAKAGEERTRAIAQRRGEVRAGTTGKMHSLSAKCTLNVKACCGGRLLVCSPPWQADTWQQA